MRVRVGITTTLLAIIVGMALGVGSPSAQVEAALEGEGHCTAVTAEGHSYEGGCHLQGINRGSFEWRALFGIMYLCDLRIEARIDENGEGAIYDQALLVPGTTDPCGLYPCRESGGASDPWPFEITSEATAETVLCIAGTFGVVVNCHLSDLELAQASHEQLALTTAGTTHRFCEDDNTNAWLGQIDLTSDYPGLIVE